MIQCFTFPTPMWPYIIWSQSLKLLQKCQVKQWVPSCKVWKILLTYSTSGWTAVPSLGLYSLTWSFIRVKQKKRQTIRDWECTNTVETHKPGHSMQIHNTGWGLLPVGVVSGWNNWTKSKVSCKRFTSSEDINRTKVWPVDWKRQVDLSLRGL